jgi:Cys-rich repeat protein
LCHYGAACVQCNSSSDCPSGKTCNPGPWVCQ